MATLGLFAVGVVVAVGLLAGGVREARGTTKEATKVIPGRTSAVTFDRAESYTLYFVGPVQVRSRSEIPALAAEIGAQLRPVGSATTIVMEPYRNNDFSQRDSNGYQQIAISTFHIDTPGDYVFTSGNLAGLSEFDAQLVISPSPFRPLARNAVLALIVVVTTAILSGISTTALALSRRRNRRAQHAALVASSRNPPGWPGSVNSPGGGWIGSGSTPIVPPPPPGY